MDYIIFPSSKLDTVPKERIEELYLSSRKSIDGEEVVMKLIHYNELFKDDGETVLRIILLNDDVDSEHERPDNVYTSEEIRTILAGDKWCKVDM